MGLFTDFHKKGLFEKSLNVIFISLLAKVPGADDINKFTPISLGNFVDKIIAKVLASRLKKVVRPYQHAFIIGYQILDAALIANDCIDSCLKSSLPHVICKLNIEKAYDHVS